MDKILIFSGKGCNPCKVVKDSLNEETIKLKNIEILYVEDNVEKSTKFRIMSLPTFVKVNDKNEELKRHSGILKLQQIIDF